MLKYLLRAAEQGDAQAQWDMHVLYSQGQEVKQSVDRATKWLKAAAKNKQSDAATRLGILYLSGEQQPHIPFDEVKSVAWFKVASREGQGNPIATSHLALFYEEGEAGVPKDPSKALEMYSKAISVGTNMQQSSQEFPFGRAQLDEVVSQCRRRETRLRQTLSTGAESSSQPADPPLPEPDAPREPDAASKEAFNQAIKLFKGIVERNSQHWSAISSSDKASLAEVVQLWTRAGEGGLANGFKNLAFIYSKGQGVEFDLARGASYSKLAAELGDRDSQFNLAVRYHEGRGVKRNSEEFLKWLKRAAVNGSPEAEETLGNLYMDGEVVQFDDTKAIMWLTKACKSGVPHAMFTLANFLLEKGGSDVNALEIISLFSNAASRAEELIQKNGSTEELQNIVQSAQAMESQLQQTCDPLLGCSATITGCTDKPTLNCCSGVITHLDSTKKVYTVDVDGVSSVLPKECLEVPPPVSHPWHKHSMYAKTLKVGMNAAKSSWKCDGFSTPGGCKGQEDNKGPGMRFECAEGCSYSLCEPCWLYGLENEADERRAIAEAKSEADDKQKQEEAVALTEHTAKSVAQSETQQEAGALFEKAKGEFNSMEKDVNAKKAKWEFLKGRKKFKAAEALLESAADKGHAEAQYKLGSLYVKGIVGATVVKTKGGDGNKFIPRPGQTKNEQVNENAMMPNSNKKVIDLQRAKLWLRKAADQGHVEAQAEVGVLYVAAEEKSENDELLACRYLELAVRTSQDGNVHARLGDLRKNSERLRDLYKAEAHYRRAVELGCRVAQKLLTSTHYQLGNQHQKGASYQADCEARAWWERATDHPEALYNLAMFQKNGFGGYTRDEDEAAKLWKKAAKLGSSNSAFSLGNYYADCGDYIKADKWLSKAVQEKHPEALNLKLALTRSGHIQRNRPKPVADKPDPVAAAMQEATAIKEEQARAAKAAVAEKAILEDLEKEERAKQEAKKKPKPPKGRFSDGVPPLSSGPPRAEERECAKVLPLQVAQQRVDTPMRTAAAETVAGPATGLVKVNNGSDGDDSDEFVDARDEIFTSDDEAESPTEKQKGDDDVTHAKDDDDDDEDDGDGEGDEGYRATLAESQLAETNREREDTAAAGYVEAFVARLEESTLEGPRFGGRHDPARDGDCLVRCAVEHDFGPVQEEEFSDESRHAKEEGDEVLGFSSPVGQESTNNEEPAAPPAADALAPLSPRLTADELRLQVVARVRANRLGALAEEVARVEDELRECVETGGAAGAVAEEGGEDEEGEDARDAREEAVEDLRGELAWLQGDARDAVEAHCATMARPGTVMGEDELQALADVREARLTVRSLVCVVESSDKGATLPDLHYDPKPWPTGFGTSPPRPDPPQGVLPPHMVPPPRVGNGDVLLLLQEVRSHRMSHFQLLKLRPSGAAQSAGTAVHTANVEGAPLETLD